MKIVNTIKDYDVKMKKVIAHLLKLDDDILEALFLGDPFTKILRNISTRKSDGAIFYKHKNMFDHFPRSKKADEIINTEMNDDEKIKELYLEHDYPFNLTLKDLRTAKQEEKDINTMMEIIEKGLEVTLITKNEAKIIDSKYKISMPDEGTRYAASKIEIITTEV